LKLRREGGREGEGEKGGLTCILTNPRAFLLIGIRLSKFTPRLKKRYNKIRFEWTRRACRGSFCRAIAEGGEVVKEEEEEKGGREVEEEEKEEEARAARSSEMRQRMRVPKLCGEGRKEGGRGGGRGGRGGGGGEGGAGGGGGGKKE